MEAAVLEVSEIGADNHAVEKAYKQLLQEEAQLKLEIKTSLCSHADGSSFLEPCLNDLGGTLPSMQAVFSGVDKLDCRIKETKDMADVVSLRVREIDTARSNALAALLQVKGTIRLRSCLEDVKQAMENEDVTAAANIIQEYRAISTRVTDDEDFHQEGTLELRMYEEKLAKTALEYYVLAANDRDDSKVLVACKILSQLGQKQIAVSRLVQYKNSQLEKDIDLEIELTRAVYEREIQIPEYGAKEEEEDQSTQKTFLNLQVYLLNQGASAIQKTLAVAKSEISSDAQVLGLVVKSMHNACNTSIVKILKLFMETRLLESRVKLIVKDKLTEAMNVGKPQWVDSGSEESEDIAIISLDTLLDEIALLLKHTDTYSSFIRVRYQKCNLNYDSIDDNLEFNTTCQELCNFYSILEEAYMFAAISKAIEHEVLLECMADSVTDKEVQKSIFVSSVAEDSFFVFDKCRDRAVAVGHVGSTCAVVNSLIKTIDENLKPLFQHRIVAIKNFTQSIAAQGQERFENLKAAASSGFQNMRNNNSPVVDNLEMVETSLNTVSLCQTYTSKLQFEFEQYAEELETNKEALKNCVDGFFECQDGFRRTRDMGVDQLLTTVKSHLISNLETTMSGVNFELSEDAFQQRKDTSVNTIVDTAKESLQRISTTLDYENSILMGTRVSALIAKGIEQSVVRKKFTAFGALLLDKQIRSFVVFFERFVGEKSAAEFHRLGLISNLLNLDTVGDIFQVYDEEISSSLLNAKEVKRILALRVDFKSDDIKKIKL